MNTDTVIKNLSGSLSLGASAPNPIVLEEALSLDVLNLDTISKNDILKYLTVLGQYLITLKFAENLKFSAYTNLNKVFEHKMNQALLTFDDSFPDKKRKTIKEKRSFLIEKDVELHSLYEQLCVLELESNLVSNMSRPVEEYIQVLKRVLASKESNNNV